MQRDIIRDKIQTAMWRTGGKMTGMPIADNASLVEDIGLDSYDRLELILILETELGVEIDDRKVGGFTTFDHVVDYVTELCLVR